MMKRPELEDLCLDCGICCNGILFEKVEVDESEYRKLKQSGNFNSDTLTRDRLLLPCAAHRNNCCQVYANRPSMCSKFKCNTLRQFENGKISRREADQRVAFIKGETQKIDALTKEAGIELSTINFARQLHIVDGLFEEATEKQNKRVIAVLRLRLAAVIKSIRSNFVSDNHIHE